MRFKYLVYLSIVRCMLVAESSTWKGSNGGEWEKPGNWTNGVPGIIGSVSTPDIEAIIDNSSVLGNLLINITETFKLNTINVLNQSCTLQGLYPLVLGGGSLPVNVSLSNAVLEFKNPLTIEGNGKITFDPSTPSNFLISSGLQCENSKINFSITGSDESYLNCSSAQFSNSDFTFSTSSDAFFSSMIITNGSHVKMDSSLLIQAIKIKSLDVEDSSIFRIKNSKINDLTSNNSEFNISDAYIVTLMSTDSNGTLENVNFSNGTFIRTSLTITDSEIGIRVNPIGSGNFDLNDSQTSFSFTSNNLTINNSNLSPHKLTLAGCALEMNNSGSNIIENASINNSNAKFSNSLFEILNIELEHSNIFLFSKSLLQLSTLSMDSLSSIQLNNSELRYIGNTTFQPRDITFDIAVHFIGTEIPYILSSADIDLSNSINTIQWNGPAPNQSWTFILYQLKNSSNQIKNLNNGQFNFPANSSNIIWQGPILKNGQVTVTADVQDSVAASIRSVMSTSSQAMLSTTRQLANSRQNAIISNQTYLSTNAFNQDNSHVVENEILSQSTPVEQLWERGVYRPSHNWSVYMAPMGSFGSTKSKKLQPGSDFYTAGFFAGFDWVNSYHTESNIGFGLGSTFYYVRLHADTEQRLSEVDVDHIFANIYGTVFPRRLEELSFNFGLGAGYNWYDMERVTGHFGSLVAHSETKGHEIGSFAGIEYLFSSIRYPRMGNFRFMPMFYLQYNRLEIDEYSERGAGEFNMRVRADDLDSLRSFLGTRANYLYKAGQNVTVRPEITVGWQREYFSDSICSAFNTIELATPQGVCSTIAPEKNTLIIGADMYVEMFQWTSLELNYQFTCNNILRNHEFYLQWKVEF